MKFNPELFAEDIVARRHDKRLSSMSKAALEIGVSKATLSRIERCQLPDMATLVLILVWLDKPFERYIKP